MEGDADVRVPADDDANQRQLLDSFCGITSASRAEAVFFLDSHKWQLDSAIHSFYDTNQDQHVDPPQRQGLPEEEGDEDEDDEDDEDYLPPEVHREKKAGGIQTLADLNRQASGTASDTDSDGPQEYYAGGQRSGMLVQNPPRKSHDVDSLFEQARQMGATEGPYENSQPSSNSRSFTGRGRLLSGETVDAAPQTQQPENIVHNIVFWTNGFTVDDGPLRRFDDPSNASFLESIKKSECPRELEPSDKRSSVHVNLSRKEQKYSVPVKRKSPFQGAGRTLGSCSGTGDTELPVPSNNESRSSVGLSIDDSLPSTSIQLRLADGTRMVARFNMHRTVGDIHSFINASRPGANRNYHLQTVGFPPKQLTDMDVTIDQAGLANSVVIQRCR